MPPGLSSLEKLKYLSLAIASAGASLPYDVAQHGHDLSCLQGLTSLEELNVHACAADIFVPSGVTALQNLSKLSLSVAPDEERAGADVPSVIFDVDWPALQLLKSLFIGAPTFICRRSIVGLATVKQLACTTWVNSVPYDAESTNCFAALMYRLAKYRPEVVVVLDKDAIQDVL